MKRALLIAAGTVSGLGAVLAITPPQLGVTHTSDSLASGIATTPASQKLTPAPTKPSSKATPKSSATSAQSAQTVPTASSTPSSVASSGYSGTVTGASFSARNYGVLAATVTFSNGKITSVSASQSPRSWSDNSLSSLIPFVSSDKITVEQIKQYPAAQLPCATQNSCRSQASFSAEAFWSSVKSAISKAGL